MSIIMLRTNNKNEVPSRILRWNDDEADAEGGLTETIIIIVWEIH